VQAALRRVDLHENHQTLTHKDSKIKEIGRQTEISRPKWRLRKRGDIKHDKRVQHEISSNNSKGVSFLPAHPFQHNPPPIELKRFKSDDQKCETETETNILHFR